MESAGYLRIIIGPMMSGKTTLLRSILHKYQITGFSVLYINSRLDNRVNHQSIQAMGMASTHNLMLNNRQFYEEIMLDSLWDLVNDHQYQKFDVLGIDESQFFDSELVPVVQRLVNQEKKIVICSGLKSNYRREKFGYILDLIPESDEVTNLSALCIYCKKASPHLDALHRANFTYRWVADDSSSSNQKEVLIGGVDKYHAVCRYHYFHPPK